MKNGAKILLDKAVSLTLSFLHLAHGAWYHTVFSFQSFFSYPVIFLEKVLFCGEPHLEFWLPFGANSAPSSYQDAAK